MDKKHKDKPTDEKKAKCEHCFKEFSSLKKLKEHCKHFHGLSLKCEICGVTCITKFEYDEHMISHGEKPKDVQKSEIAVGSLLPKTEKTHIRKCQISGCEAQFETAQGKYFSKKRKLCPNSCVIYTVLFY